MKKSNNQSVQSVQSVQSGGSVDLKYKLTKYQDKLGEARNTNNNEKATLYSKKVNMYTSLSKTGGKQTGGDYNKNVEQAMKDAERAIKTHNEGEIPNTEELTNKIIDLRKGFDLISNNYVDTSIGATKGFVEQRDLILNLKSAAAINVSEIENQVYMNLDMQIDQINKMLQNVFDGDQYRSFNKRLAVKSLISLFGKEPDEIEFNIMGFLDLKPDNKIIIIDDTKAKTLEDYIKKLKEPKFVLVLNGTNLLQSIEDNDPKVPTNASENAEGLMFLSENEEYRTHIQKMIDRTGSDMQKWIGLVMDAQDEYTKTHKDFIPIVVPLDPGAQTKEGDAPRLRARQINVTRRPHVAAAAAETSEHPVHVHDMTTAYNAAHPDTAHPHI